MNVLWNHFALQTERNSPLKVVREFELLWRNEWADAKVALDEYADWKVKDKDKYEILTSALMVWVLE